MIIFRLSNLHQISAELTETDNDTNSESLRQDDYRRDYNNSFPNETSSFGTTESDDYVVSEIDTKQVAFKITSDIEVISE